MDLALGLVVGFVFGMIVALLEMQVLNRKLKKMETTGDNSNKSLLVMFGLRYLINPAVLLIVFLLRKHVPFDPYGLLIGTAFGITIPTQIWAIRLNKQAPK